MYDATDRYDVGHDKPDISQEEMRDSIVTDERNAAVRNQHSTEGIEDGDFEATAYRYKTMSLQLLQQCCDQWRTLWQRVLTQASMSVCSRSRAAITATTSW